QVLDPVVGVGTAAWGGPHLRDPWPDGGWWCIDRHRTRRNAVRLLEQLVAGEARARLHLGRPPGEDPAPQRAVVRRGGERSEGHSGQQGSSQPHSDSSRTLRRIWRRRIRGARCAYSGSYAAGGTSKAGESRREPAYAVRASLAM